MTVLFISIEDVIIRPADDQCSQGMTFAAHVERVSPSPFTGAECKKSVVVAPSFTSFRLNVNAA